LFELGVRPDVIIEPTCGTGSFLLAAAKRFPDAREVLGFEVNGTYLDELRATLVREPSFRNVRLEQADFFDTRWGDRLRNVVGSLLVVGNFPWVTNAAQGVIGGSNLPKKSNFQHHRGFDAISGKANFDISEWMLVEALKWFAERPGCIGMLVKTAVARKVLAQAKAMHVGVKDALMIRIDAKKEFGASVDACLLVARVAPGSEAAFREYTIYDSFDDNQGRQVGQRRGLMVSDIGVFDATSDLLGRSPVKWRSGVKHDAVSVMEIKSGAAGLCNGVGQRVDMESTYLYPLMKGSDVGAGRAWNGRFVIVPQRYVGEPTDPIRTVAPRTWEYLEAHASTLDRRGSTVYVRGPRFSIFGVGDYAFRPWRVAICALYKSLKFCLVGPIDGRPVMFDDTTYYVSFETEQEAQDVFGKLNNERANAFLDSLTFWDEKRPIKTSILNALDWSKVKPSQRTQKREAAARCAFTLFPVRFRQSA